MDDEATYAQLKALVDTAPDLASQARGLQLPVEAHLWMGRLHAIVDTQGNVPDVVLLKTATGRMRSSVPGVRLAAVDDVMAVLFRALAEAELRSPSRTTGSFIAVGSAFDALRALAVVLNEAVKEVLIVDPYMSEVALSDVAILAEEGINVRLLSDAATVKPGLKPAAVAWGQQYGLNRPLEVRLSVPKSLHDRLILVDRSKVWVLTQSLKDLAKRAPASLTAVDSETAGLKIDAYEALWSTATPVY